LLLKKQVIQEVQMILVTGRTGLIDAEQLEKLAQPLAQKRLQTILVKHAKGTCSSMKSNKRSFWGELYNSRNVLSQLVSQQLVAI
jgi:hypothetical protein